MSVKHFVVTEKGVGALRVGEMVAVATQRSGEQNVHWTLGSVESAPYVHDVEVRLWARVQEDDVNFGASEAETEEERALIEQTNRMRGELSRSMQQATELTEKLRERRRSIIHAIEDTENHIAESRAAVHAAKTDVERISYRHWQELKSYRVPPKMVLTILRAVMLLLSEDGATEWPQMQRVLRDQHFKSRILEYDPRVELSSDRADYVLRECVRRKSFRYVRAVKSSQAMGPIYYWVLAQLDSTEANAKKTQLEKKMISSKKELGEVMKEIQKQHESIAEYQALMDKTDDQLHAYREEQRRRRLSQQLDSIHKSRDIESARRRYEESFAAAEKKEYLRPAFYSWKPTDYCMVILRKNIIEDFGSVTQQQWDENKYILNEAQIHALDDALQRHRKSVNDLHTDEEGRKRREEEEDAEIEEGLFRTVVQDDSNDGSLNVIKHEFNGEHWKPILDRKRLVIIKAFCSDTAEALQVQESDVSVTHLESFPSSRQLVICAEVQNTNFESKKNIQTIIRDYPYPQMEALYIKDAENFNQHQKRFEGKEWESIISTHKSDVKHVFELDTAAALNINHETDVNVTSVDFDDKLLLLYKVNKPTLTFNEVNNIVDNYPYPLLWGLYNAYKKEETSGIKQFHGSHWERALNTYKTQLTDAFKNDTARALDVPQTDIEVQTIKATDDALIFGYTTRVKQKDMDVQQALHDYDYPETWQLYKEAANQKDLEENVWTEHCSAFEGVGWREVVQEKKSALLHAFIKATAEIFDVEKDYLRNVIAKYVDQKLLFIFEFKHPASLTNANIVEKLESCEYVPVWALYREQVLEYKIVTTHEIGFEGEDWDYVIQQKGAEVKEAVATETALALQLNREEILNVELETFPQRLSAIVTVKHSANMKKHQILEELTNRHYNQVWMLYQPRPLESSELTKRFDGDDWDIVLDGSRKKLEEAFRKETAAALNVSPHQVMLVSCRIGSLLVDFKVRGCTLSDEEITRLTDAHPYHEVYALYVPRIAPTGESCAAVSRVLRADEEGEASPVVDVWTQHHVGFDGEGWHYVVETREADLHSAFVNGIVEAFKLEQENVRNVVMTCVDDGMLVDFELQHPDTLTDADVNMQLKECMYKDVWALYREQVLEYKIVTTHEIGFEGEDWDYVMERKGAEVKEAVATETARGLGSEREDVVGVELDVLPQNLIAFVAVRHSPLLSERRVEENLGQCDYRALWALYEARPLESSELTKRFDGDDWDIVLDGSRKKLEEAFRKETAAALNVSPHQVMLVSCRIGSLLVDFKVRGCTLSDEEITRLTDAHPYHEVYALYVPRIAPTGESCAAVSRVLRADEEGEASPVVDVWTQHHVGFDGEGWHYVVETREADLHSAFVNGTVEAFKLEQENVRNVVMTCVDDGMLVDFELQHPDTLTDADVNMQLKECMYKDVWALYREQVLEYKIVTTHEIGFEGEDWDYVIQQKGAEVKEAVATETARGLGSEREDVVGVELDVLPQNLIAFVAVRHSPLLSERRVEENLGQCDYRALWALYEARPLESSELKQKWICAEEVEVEEDQLVYLRSALSRARRERDEYRECVESFDVQRGRSELIDAG